MALAIEQNKSRSILFPVDGSENADRAYQFYRKNIMRPRDNLIIGHVIEPPNLPALGIDLSLSYEAWTKIMVESNAKAAALENTWCQKLLANGDSFEYHHVVGRCAGACIVELANEVGADLIIMANRGLGKIRRTILGSVSEYVLHHVKVPVTIVPPFKQLK